MALLQRRVRRAPLALLAVVAVSGVMLVITGAFDPRCQCTDDALTGDEARRCSLEGTNEAERDAYCASLASPLGSINCNLDPIAAAANCAWKRCRRPNDCAVGTFCNQYGACSTCGNAPGLVECERYTIDHDCCSAEFLKQCPENFDTEYLAQCDVPCELPKLDSRESPTSCRAATPAGALAMPECVYDPLDCRDQHDVHCCRYDEAEACAVCSPVDPPWCDETGSKDPTLGSLPDSALDFSVQATVQWRFVSVTIRMLITNQRRCIAWANYTLELPLDARIDQVEVSPSDNSHMSAAIPLQPQAALNETEMAGPWDSAHYLVRVPVPSSGSTLMEIRYHHGLERVRGAVAFSLPLAPNPSTQRTNAAIHVDDSGVVRTMQASAVLPPYQTFMAIDTERRLAELYVPPAGPVVGAFLPTGSPLHPELIDTCRALVGSAGRSTFVLCNGHCIPRTDCARQVRLSYTPSWHAEAGTMLHDEYGRMLYLFSPPSVQDETCNDPPVPRNIVMVMDTTGWMRGKRLRDTKQLFLSLLSVNGSMQFHAQDALSIHTFAKRGVEASWGPRLITEKNRQSAIDFVRAIEFGPYIDEIVPRYVARNLHEAYVEGLRKLGTMMARPRIEAPIDFDGSRQAACEQSFHLGCSHVDSVPMMMLVSAGRPTDGITDPAEFVASIQDANVVGAKIVTVALGEPLDEHVKAEIRDERNEINRQIEAVHRQMAPRQGYTLSHVSPRDRRIFMKRLEGLDSRMALTGEHLDLNLLNLLHRRVCGRLLHVHEERPDTVHRMLTFLENELAVPLLFNVSVQVQGADILVPRETPGQCTHRILLSGGEIALPGFLHSGGVDMAQVSVSVTARGSVGRRFSAQLSMSADAAPTMTPRAGGALLALAQINEMMSYAAELEMIGETPSLCQSCSEQCNSTSIRNSSNVSDVSTPMVCSIVCTHAGNATSENKCELTGNVFIPALVRRAGSRSIPASCTNGGNASSRDLCERTGFVFTPRTNRSATTRAAAAELAHTGLPGGGPAFWAWPPMTAVEIEGWPEGSKLHKPATTYLRHIPQRHYRAENELPPVRPLPPILPPDPIYTPPRPLIDWASLAIITTVVVLVVGLSVGFQIGYGVGWFKNGLPELYGVGRRQLVALLLIAFGVLDSCAYCAVATCRVGFSFTVLLVAVVAISFVGVQMWKQGEVLEVVCPRDGIGGNIIRVDREGRHIKNYYTLYPTVNARRYGPTSMDVIVPHGVRKGQSFQVQVNFEHHGADYRPIVLCGRKCCGIHVPHNEHACGKRLGRLHMWVESSVRKLLQFIRDIPRAVVHKICQGFGLVVSCGTKIRTKLCKRRSDAYALEEENKVKTPEELKDEWMAAHKAAAVSAAMATNPAIGEARGAVDAAEAALAALPPRKVVKEPEPEQEPEKDSEKDSEKGVLSDEEASDSDSNSQGSGDEDASAADSDGDAKSEAGGGGEEEDPAVEAERQKLEGELQTAKQLLEELEESVWDREAAETEYAAKLAAEEAAAAAKEDAPTGGDTDGAGIDPDSEIDLENAGESDKPDPSGDSDNPGESVSSDDGEESAASGNGGSDSDNEGP